MLEVVGLLLAVGITVGLGVVAIVFGFVQLLKMRGILSDDEE